MSDKSEPSKYIGYSMRKKQWVSIKPKDKRIDTYEFFDSGATAFTYVNPSSNKLVKIIHGPRYEPDDDYAEFITECEIEIEYQYRASINGLGPHIYRRQSGFMGRSDIGRPPHPLAFVFFVPFQDLCCLPVAAGRLQ